MKKIIITNRDKQGLSALLHEPTNQTNSIIILTHSFKGDKDYQPIMGDFSRHICSEGFAVLRFDCWGSGESDGEFINSSIETQVNDLKDVIQYVKTLGYVNICLIGLSLGTTDSIMAYDESIKCIVMWSPVFQHQHLHDDYKDEVLKNGYIIRKRNLTGGEVKCGKKMWQSFADVKPYLRLKELQCPVLAIIGSNDDHITETKAKEFMYMIPAQNELIVIDGGDHDFLINEAKKKAMEHTTDFIKEHLT